MCLIAVIQLSKTGKTVSCALTIFCPFAGITPQNRKSEDYRQKKSKHLIMQQEMRLTVRRISAQGRGSGFLSCLGNERTPKSATVKGRNFMKKSQLPILENGKLALRSVCLAHSLSTIF
ncbi:MAG: hypothetical protein J1E06_01965, partial [Acutalibacter sp.]|nr:hypothetical protein [Acutalibacter sp.]